jgi:hypothetical protein
LPSINDHVKESEIGRLCSSIRKKKSAYRIFMGKPKRNRPRLRWVDNIKIDLVEIVVEWIGLIWCRLSRALMNAVP